jgi:lauroyl/myristoyl acyltransferase
VIYRLWRLARGLVTALPLPLVYAGADVVGLIAWLIMPVQRSNAVENMRRVVGARRARKVACRSFQNYCRYVADFIRHTELPAAHLLTRMEWNDWSFVDGLLAGGRGCILVLMHFGNWDVGAGVLALRGYPFNAVAETQGDERLDRDLVAARTARGVKLIPMERAATGIVRAMRRNEFLAILLDRPLDAGGVEVRFFGAPTRVPEGPARIALRTGATVLPVGLARRRRNDDVVRPLFERPIVPERSGDDERDVIALTQTIMSAHERIIRRHPDQWYMFRRMWPAAPADSPSPAAAASPA